ncbi:restriction endonuclease subunit S [Mesomycoplasma conjunctivae]|uniref:restriction endonuclease subunit S n=1 Tax=Mesomycoplasma conjunctivae TaxID=45361 RepID=UPI003DA2A9C3
MKKYRKLSEVAEIITGKLDSNAAADSGIYPFFTCGAEPLRIHEFAYDMDAILLAGNNAQGNFHCQRFKGKFNAYQRTYIIAPKFGYNIDYIFYNLKINLSNFKRLSQGSQTKFLTMDILDSFLIEDLPFSKQIENTKLLSILDKKIEINKQINDNLVKQMNFIFQNMMSKVMNNRIKGEYVSVKNLTQVVTGKEDANFSDENGKYKFFTCSNEILKCNEYKFNSSSVLIAGNGDFNVKHYTGKFNAYQRTYVLTPQKDYYALLYLSSVERINALKLRSTGSIIKFITKNDIESIPVFIPWDKNISNILNQLLSLKDKNSSENEYLISLRDYLLPLLLNGQVTVED